MSRRLFLAVVLAVATPLAAPAAAVTSPSSLVIFGDSLVDAGNIFLATGGAAPSNTFNNPSRGYYPGRFTNGLDYTDLLSQRLYGTLSTPSLGGGTNYAYGGARIVNNGDTVPDLAAQVASYFVKTSNIADPNALYIINAGGNDVFGLESGNIGGFPNSTLYTTNLLTTLTGSIQALSNAGAQRILVTGIPNLDATGFALDGQVQTALTNLQPSLGTTQLLRFSYLNFFVALQANPAAFGVPAFTKTGNCIDQNLPYGTIDCTGYSSFDGIHPVASIQTAIYNQVLGVTGLGAVPEPATWAMMIGGFGMIGLAARRRRAVVAA